MVGRGWLGAKLNYPSISVVVINLNNADGLRRTLESVLDQSVDNAKCSYDVFVVDGVSKDDSVVVAEAFAESDQRVAVISERDEGVYDAMNKGIDQTTGDYLIFMNSGDRFATRTALDTIFSEIRTCPAWLVTGATNLGGGRRDSAIINNLPHSWLRHALGVQPHCHQASVFRRDVVSALGGYRCRFGLIGDFDFILRCGAISRPREVPNLLVDYEGGGMSEYAWRSIPSLQHQVRVDVLDLRSPLAALSLLWSRYLIARRSIARVKARLLSVVRN